MRRVSCVLSPYRDDDDDDDDDFSKHISQSILAEPQESLLATAALVLCIYSFLSLIARAVCFWGVGKVIDHVDRTY
jgi:hypothetical protein